MSDVISWYKGSRDYIHATDLLASAWTLLPDIRSFAFSSRRNATHPTLWVPEAAANRPDMVATFACVGGSGVQERFAAIQDTSRTIDKHIPFDEERLLAGATLAGNAILAELNPGFSLWEHVSAMQKRLLTQLFRHPEWWLVRLEGNALFQAPQGIIRIEYQGSRQILLRSAISLNGASAGAVDFARREEPPLRPKDEHP